MTNQKRNESTSRFPALIAAALFLCGALNCNADVDAVDTDALILGYAAAAVTNLGETQAAGTLTWARCSFGQVWDASVQYCLGSAATVSFCDANDNDCNDGTDAGVLNGNNLLNGGTSLLWTTCDTLVLGGRTDWRVPTKAELRTLIVCSNGPSQETIADNAGCNSNSQPPTLNQILFPGTFTDTGYFTSDSATTTQAWAVNFRNGNIVNTVNKATGRHVRCVAGTSQ